MWFCGPALPGQAANDESRRNLRPLAKTSPTVGPLSSLVSRSTRIGQAVRLALDEITLSRPDDGFAAIDRHFAPEEGFLGPTALFEALVGVEVDVLK